jgi:ubiquitin-conjugating enzyme E2 variant
MKVAPPPLTRPRWIPWLEYAAAAACVALAAPVVRTLFTSGNWLVCGAAALAGYLLADLVSGLVHWFGDTFFEEDTPVWGTLFVGPFREHHRDPLAMTRHSFGELNGSNCLGVAPLLLIALTLRETAAEHSWALFGMSVLLFFSLSIAVTNQIHSWCHAPRAPKAAVWLQRRGLILSPERHASHHQGGSRDAYCVTTGWMNNLLDRSGVLRKGEHALQALGVPVTSEVSPP